MEGFDLSTISDIYVGSIQYSEIYYGSNKVWPTQSPGTLPPGYTQVEYIESTNTGGQYIDLDILLYDVLNKQYDIAIKFLIKGNGKNTSRYGTLFGCEQNIYPYPGTFIRYEANNRIIGRYIGANVADNNLGSINTIIELTEKTPPAKNVYNYDNSGRTHTWGTSLFSIMNANRNPERFVEARLYYFKLFVEGALVRDMVPCISPDNIAGLYDLANDKFYSSLNGAEFLTSEDYCKLTLDDDSVVYITDGNGTLTQSMINPYRSNIVGVEFKGKRYTNIQAQAFQGCTLLTTVNLLPNITSIGEYAFYNCTSLISVEDLSPNITSISSYAFYSCSSLTDIDLSNITSIYNNAFYGCSSLTSVADTSNLTSIGNYTFSGCSSLTSVDLSSCTSIGDDVFYNCTSLISIGDLSSCTSIGNYTFYNRNKITGNIDIGSSCISLGTECFKGMTGLSTMTFIGTTPPTCGSVVFAGSTFTIRVPQSALETYKAADGFSDYASRIVGY